MDGNELELGNSQKESMVFTELEYKLIVITNSIQEGYWNNGYLNGQGRRTNN